MDILEKDGVLTLDACAKVNLFLRIVGKRTDGYHEIYTLFVPVSIFDTLSIRESATTTLSCSDKDIPVDCGNIIIKTDTILRERYGLRKHFDIELTKRIPVGAGLGGGSSDAAAYMRLADRAAGLGLTYGDMKGVMESVGSDTIFFIKSVPAVGRGRGELLTDYHGLPPLWFVIVNPRVFVPTKSIYASASLEFTGARAGGLRRVMDFDDIRAIMVNDMQSAVFEMYPQVAELRRAMDGAEGGAALMSGSGSTVFAVYRDEQSRDRAYGRFAALWGNDYLVTKAGICGA